MTNSHVSYLQTLTEEEAIAFVTSLQKVKEHLSHELQWMNEQVQQKTVQRQGIDTLLSEAVELGLLPPHAAAIHPSVTSGKPASVTVGQANESITLATTNGNNLAAETTAPPKRGRQRQPNKPATPKRDAKSSTVGKPGVTKTTTDKAKKPGRPAQSASGANNASPSGFQQFMQTDFQDKSMTDAVGEILATAKEPMNTDAIMAELYEGLSGDSYQRAKSSLSNILSVGKSKGKWKSPGRGTYIGS